MIQGVSYVRVSTEEQAAEGRSLEVQERANREYAQKHGIELVKVFVEAASAFRWNAREQFHAMCQYVEKHPEIEVLVVWKTIRAVRNLSDYAYLSEQLRGGKGLQIHSVTERFPNTTTGQLMGGISAAFGRWQSTVISEQASAGMQAWAESGVYPSRAPIGYRNRKRDNPKQRGLGVEINPEEAAKVVELFEMYASGRYSITDVFDYAQHLKLQTCFGTVKSRNTVYNLLKDEFYVGYYSWNGQRYKGIHESIVSSATFETVQRLIGVTPLSRTV